MLILTNAAGSLKPKMRPGSIMMMTDHINQSGMNPLIGSHGDENFVPMTDAYDPANCRRPCKAAAKKEKLKLHQGVYVWYSGPSFETPAEIRMFRIIGGTRRWHVDRARNNLARRFGLRGGGPFGHHQSGRRHRRRLAIATRKPSAKAPRRRSA